MLKVRHVFTTTGATLVSGGLGVLFAVLAGKLLTPTQNGHYAQFVLVFNLYYVLFNFGLGPASTYFIASGRMDLRQVIAPSLKVILVTGLISLLGLIFLVIAGGAAWVEVYFKIPQIFLFAGVVAGFFLLVFNQALAVTVGKRNFDIANVLNVGKALLPFFFLLLFQMMFAEESAFIFSNLAALVVVSLLGMAFVLTGLKKREDLTINKKYLNQLVGYGVLVYASNMMSYVAMRGLLIFMSYYQNPEYVGYFSMALVFMETVLIVPSVIGQLIFPQSSSLEYDSKLTDAIIRLNLYVSLGMVVAVIVLAPVIIEAILGSAYRWVSVALCNLTPSIFILAVPRILSQVLAGQGHLRYNLGGAISSFIFGGVLAYFIVPGFGLLGAVWVANTISVITAAFAIIGYSQLRSISVIEIFQPRRSDLQLILRLLKSK